MTMSRSSSPEQLGSATTSTSLEVTFFTASAILAVLLRLPQPVPRRPCTPLIPRPPLRIFVTVQPPSAKAFSTLASRPPPFPVAHAPPPPPLLPPTTSPH